MSALNDPGGSPRGLRTTRWFWFHPLSARSLRVALPIALLAVATSAGGVAVALSQSRLSQAELAASTPVPRATAGVHPASPAVPAVASGPRGGFQMRCWQYGRLVLDEPLGQLPAEAPGQTIRLQGMSAQYALVHAGSTTCLVKPVTERGPVLRAP